MSNHQKQTDHASPQAAAGTAPEASPVLSWLIRLAKGALVGIGAIVPGFSGGVLAVVFGIYEPLLRSWQYPC